MRSVQRMAILCLATIGLGASATARAQVVITLLDPIDDIHGITLTPGATFDVDAQLETIAPLASGQFKLIETTSPISGYFTLDALSSSAGWLSPPLADPTPTAVPPSWAAGPAGDIGTVADDPLTGNGSGPIFTLHLQLSGSAQPGVYFLNVTDAIFGDTQFSPVPYTVGQDYRVEVVPDAQTWILLIGGAMLSIGLTWRQSRVHHAFAASRV